VSRSDGLVNGSFFPFSFRRWNAETKDFKPKLSIEANNWFLVAELNAGLRNDDRNWRLEVDERGDKFEEIEK
jgi:hypothetical protein